MKFKEALVLYSKIKNLHIKIVEKYTLEHTAASSGISTGSGFCLQNNMFLISAFPNKVQSAGHVNEDLPKKPGNVVPSGPMWLSLKNPL